MITRIFDAFMSIRLSLLSNFIPKCNLRLNQIHVDSFCAYFFHGYIYIYIYNLFSNWSSFYYLRLLWNWWIQRFAICLENVCFYIFIVLITRLRFIFAKECRKMTFFELLNNLLHAVITSKPNIFNLNDIHLNAWCENVLVISVHYRKY